GCDRADHFHHRRLVVTERRRNNVGIVHGCSHRNGRARTQAVSSRTDGSRVMSLYLASGLPFALALRIGIAAATILTAPRRHVARRVGFLGSAAASLATGLAAVQVLRSGTPVSG